MIKWAVIDLAMGSVKYVESATIGATPPQGPRASEPHPVGLAVVFDPSG